MCNKKLFEKICVRVDIPLLHDLLKTKNKGVCNLSAFIREAIREKLNRFLYIDNSEQGKELEKDVVISTHENWCTHSRT